MPERRINLIGKSVAGPARTVSIWITPLNHKIRNRPHAFARVRRDAGHLDPDRRARPRGLRAAWLPDRPPTAARGPCGVPAASQAPGHRGERLRGVQAARQRLCDGRPRDSLPGSGHPRRVRRTLPVVRPGLLRVLRPRGHHEHRVAQREADRPRDARAGPAAGVPDLQRCGTGLRRGECAAPGPGEWHRDAQGRRGRGQADHRGDAGAGRGRGRHARGGAGRAGRRRPAPDLRAAAVLRADASRAWAHRAPGHHLPDLRHLPGGVRDERLSGDRGRLRGQRPGGHHPDAPAALLRRVDREPHAARLPAARPGLPRLSRRHRDGQGPRATWWRAGCG